MNQEKTAVEAEVPETLNLTDEEASAVVSEAVELYIEAWFQGRGEPNPFAENTYRSGAQ
jgi:hypothetical protein